MEHDIGWMMDTLAAAAPAWETPVVTHMAEVNRDPYRILIATLISLRTKDGVTGAAARRLFALADTPGNMAALGEDEIARAIYPALYRMNKARTIREISRTLLDEYGGRVPDTLETLLSLRGVGRKTANLVITKGFGKPGICVDTHVHRITNRWGYVSTKSPDETEFALRKKLPERYWLLINDLLVAFGQNLCRPVSPFCSRCPVSAQCMRAEVSTHR